MASETFIYRAEDIDSTKYSIEVASGNNSDHSLLIAAGPDASIESLDFCSLSREQALDLFTAIGEWLIATSV